MTLTAWDLAIYAGAVFVLFLTPGPVWLALVARSMSGGFHAGWPLALGVAVGDMFWPLVAVIGVSSLSAASEQIALVLKGVAVLMFLVMGISTIGSAGTPARATTSSTRKADTPLASMRSSATDKSFALVSNRRFCGARVMSTYLLHKNNDLGQYYN